MNAILKKLFLGCASAIGFGALAVGATPSAVTEFSVTFNPLVDVAPVASWLVTGGEATATTFVQTSLRNDGGFADVSGGFSGAGSFAFTNLQAAVSAPFYYRLRSTDGVGDTFTAPVFCRRVRRLERDESDETKLASGVTMLPETNYTTDTASSVGRTARSAFDGGFATYSDVYSVSGGPVETVIGVCLPEAAHVTDVFMYPRDSQKGRLSSAAVLSCTSSAAFEARDTHLLAGKQTISSVDWHRYQPDDSETLYQCLFAYAGPLHDVGIGQFFGNVAEIRFYGWTPSDEAMAVGEPEGVLATPKSLQVRLSWTSAENADSIRVERRAADEADWMVIATVPASEGRYDDAAVKSRTAYEYRLVSVGLGGRMEAASDAVVATPQGPGLILMVR